VTGRQYRAGVDGVLRGTALPYGYTLTTWCSGEILVDRHGMPAAWLAMAYVAGALAAFGLIKLAARGANPVINATQLADDRHFVRAGVAHVAAVAAALGGVWLLGRIGSRVVWPAGGFAATALYLLGTAVELGRREAEAASERTMLGRP
jgi:hypothetical protein